jgi:glycosyltransferase involved in cell wall biosynthesis
LTAPLRPRRGLFVEPFYGGSHRAFADGLRAHSRHELTLLTLPEGEWRRRMRRGAQELAAALDDVPGAFDFVIATDMLDLAAFLALTRRRLGSVPVLTYFHENQFTYPRLRGTKFNSWFGQVNYLSAVSADAVAFNSEFHRQDFLGALRTLDSQPNNWLLGDTIAAIEAKSAVLPVGVDLQRLDSLRPRAVTADLPPLVLWNHRWEFDKAPVVFARAIVALAAEGVAFRVAVAGEPGLTPAPTLLALPDQLGDRVVQFGRIESSEAYGRLLWDSDIVVSTTRHEFFGIGTVEALYCGCWPVLPRRFNYPALVPPQLHARCLWGDEAELQALLRSAIVERPSAPELRESAARFDWSSVAPQWDAAIDRLAG